MTSNLPRATALATLALALAPSAAHAIPICEDGNPCPQPPAEKVHHVGKFDGAGKRYLEVRAAPYSSARVIRRVRSGARALIVCQASGSRATGPYGTSTLWDKLKKGGYISDTRIYTGSDGRVAPDCTNVPVPPPVADVFRYDDPGAWTGPASSPAAWRSYGGPNPHTDHIHIGLNRAGAAKQTSFHR